MSNAAVTIAPDRRTAGDFRLDGDAAAFGEVRSRLMGIAYRILGSWSEAEDIVQDAWLRWQLYDRTTVVNPTAFLVTTTTRLAINAAQSARARRESCVGQWLPEPVATGDDPALVAEHERRLGVGHPGAARASCAHRAGRLRAARSVRLPVPPDRPDPADHRGERSSARESSPQARRHRSATAGQ